MLRSNPIIELKRTLFRISIIFVLSVSAVSAQDIALDSFKNDGSVSWTNTVPEAEYGVLWASSLNGPWHSNWDTPGFVTATGTTAGTEVALFYRVVRWPTEGLIAYYPFTMGPDDVSTNSFTAIPSNVTKVLDRKGTGLAYSFNGSNSTINCGDHSVFNASTGVTVAGWFKTASTNAQAPVGRFNADGGYYLSVMSDYVGFNINNSPFAGTNIMPIVNEWFFVAGTWKSMETSIYLNGVLLHRDARPWEMKLPSYPLMIGCRFFSGTPSWPFDGLIDDVRIYDRALSSNEVWALYHYSH